MVDERDTFSIAARVGQHSYKITGINELTKPNMMITMKLERTSSDPKGGVDTSTFITNMKLPVAELSESPSKAPAFPGIGGFPSTRVNFWRGSNN
jgi:hypothetical protein